jgi:hypothetical protein
MATAAKTPVAHRGLLGKKVSAMAKTPFLNVAAIVDHFIKL